MAKKPAPVATANAKPTSEKKEKKEKKARVPHPALFNAAGEAVKLTSIPADFDPKLHKPLKRKDFESEAAFMRMQADEFEARAKRLRVEAEQAEKLGNTKDRAKAKKLLGMQKRIEELKAEMSKDGFDIDQLLASLNG